MNKIIFLFQYIKAYLCLFVIVTIRITNCLLLPKFCWITKSIKKPIKKHINPFTISGVVPIQSI